MKLRLTGRRSQSLDRHGESVRRRTGWNVNFDFLKQLSMLRKLAPAGGNPFDQWDLVLKRKESAAPNLKRRIPRGRAARRRVALQL